MSGSMKDLLGDELYTPSFVPAFQHHSSTSREAAHSIAPHVSDLQKRVLDFIGKNQGATDEQIIDAFGLSPSTIRPRRIELTNKLYLIKDSGRYSITKSGRKATVWVLKEQSDPVTFATAPPL